MCGIRHSCSVLCRACFFQQKICITISATYKSASIFRMQLFFDQRVIRQFWWKIKNMKRFVFLLSIAVLLVLNKQAYAQPPSIVSQPDVSGTDCLPPGPGLVDGKTNDNVRSVGIGSFSANNNPNGTRARLHVRNDLLRCPSGLMNGKLFRTDGNDKADNSWTMWTHTAGGPYNEIYKIQVPQLLPFTLELQATQKNGDIRFNTAGANFRAIITSNGDFGVNTSTPGNRVEITPSTGNPYFPVGVNGASGLRFSSLTSANTPMTNPGKGVLSVDNNGDVIYVPASGGGGLTCAQNGLNCTVSPGMVEMGGDLIRQTNVTFNGFNQCWNTFNKANGEFAITDYPSAPNSAASNLDQFYKFGVFTNNYAFGQKIENVSTTPFSTVGGPGPRGGLYLKVDRDNVGFNYTMGAELNVTSGNVGSAFGLNSQVKSRTVGTTASIVNGYGVNAACVDANHAWGGNFSASAPVQGGISTNHAIGVQGVAVGGARAYGGLFYAHTGLFHNYAVYAIANAANSSASGSMPMVGVYGVSNAIFNTGIHIGVLGIGESTTPGAPMIGVMGVSGSNSPGPAGYAPSVKAGVVGVQTTQGTWAGYFQGNVNVNGNMFQNTTTLIFSDQSIKRNVQPVENALSLIGKLNPKTYDLYNDNCKQLNFEGVKKQYGLIAQEVEKVIPEIVNDVKVPATYDEKGSVIHPERDLKGIYYEQLIALLIKGAQEQQQQIEKQQQQINDLKQLLTTNTASHSNGSVSVEAVTLSDKNFIVLNQNVPNPFSESTVITFNIPSDFSKAQIVFSTSEGKIIKTVDIREKGEASLNVFANDLSSGMYSYSLIIDGKVVDTKKMLKKN